MARFVSLNIRAGCPWLAVGVLGLTAVLIAPLQAQTTMTMQQAQTPPTPPAPVKTPATKTPALPPAPPPDTFSQYGKIVAPSDQVAHPLRLRLPFPDVGEVKIPSKDQLVMRDKLEQLATLSDEDIRTQLAKWPAFSKMSLRDEGAMLQRIQDFRDYRSNVAKGKAHDMGLLTLLPDQEARFEKEYWNKRLQMDKDLAKQFEPIYKAHEQKMLDDLYREYSAVSQGPVAQAPKPGAPPATKPAPAKPSGSTGTSAATTNVTQPMQPIAQAPH